MHFADDQWLTKTTNGKKKLKPDAVPTLFSHNPLPQKRKSTYSRSEQPLKKILLDDETIHSLPLQDNNQNIIPAAPSHDQNDVEKLKKELQAAKNLISKLQNENIALKSKIANQASQISKFKRQLQKKSKPISYQKIFNENQVEAIKHGSMIFKKWSNDTVKTALGLRFSCGTNGYENLLALNMPFPSVRTLQRRLQHIRFESGLLSEVFDLLKVKVQNFTLQQKYCVLTLDEMAIKEAIELDLNSKTYFGNVTFPGQSGSASYALVFMLAGVSTRWKQAVAYYFTNGQSDGAALKSIIIEIIKKAEELGLRLLSVTSDMGGGNQAMWKSFGILSGRHSKTNSSIIHPCDESRQIHFIADVPHLLKNIRTSLLNNKRFMLPQSFVSKYNLSSPIVTSDHIENLNDYQDDFELKLAHKLTSDILNENHFNKMKVSRATHLLSHDVSVGLKYLSDEKQEPSYLTTAWFIAVVNKWFKLMTSRHPVMALSKFNLKVYNETIAFLKEVIDLFQNLEIYDKKGKKQWKPIQTGVIISTTSILNLQEELFTNNIFDFLLTSRFSQDALENLFGIIRSKQIVPTALQFKNNLKLISIGQYFKKFSTGSYDSDDRNFLDLTNLMAEKKSKITTILLPKGWNETSINLNKAEENCLYNIAGYIMHGIFTSSTVCDTCFTFVASKEKQDAAYSKLVSLKEYKDGCLFYVKKDFFLSLFRPMEILFRCLSAYLMNCNNCHEFVLEKFITDDNIKTVKIPDCHCIKHKIIKRFVSFRLKIFGAKKTKEVNRLAKLKKSNQFSSKSAAMRVLAERVK